MAHQIPTTEPAEIRVGDTWTWSRALSDYPASTWTLVYYFRNESAFFDITASADGDDHLVAVTPATSAIYTAGRYTWGAFVSNGSERHEVGSGSIEVLADLSTAAPYDGRSHKRKMLDAVTAILESRATTDQIDLVSSSIGDRSITKDPIELRKLQQQLEFEVKTEEGTGGLVRIVTRFGNG